ncbi:uncharacterized protein DFL_006773 [Arthrobotrys flagrans]|uniref:Uncharacterized protein n=1 Tax=Arthrobotrys flagrans TaxID=97331 RepID=A0A436ZTR1_ARTFL|nr:hypothetical protein DFL_006773 [Arthrobotrys flagrans]
MSRLPCPILLCILQLLFLATVFSLPEKGSGKHRDFSKQKGPATSLDPRPTLLPHHSKVSGPRADKGDLGQQRYRRFGVYSNALRLHKRTNTNKDKRPVSSDDETEKPPSKQPKNQDDPPSRLYKAAMLQGQYSAQNFLSFRMQIQGGWPLDKESLPEGIKRVAQKERNPEQAFDCPGQEVLRVFGMLQKVIRDPQKKCRPADYVFSSAGPNRRAIFEMDVSLHNGYIGVNYEKMGTREYNPWKHNQLQVSVNAPIILYEGYNYWALATKLDTKTNPLRYIALYNIHNPDTINIVSEAHSRAKLIGGQRYLRVTSPINENTLEAEIWDAVRGTDEIEVCVKLLYSRMEELNFADVEEIYTYLSPPSDQGQYVFILLGVKGLSGSPKSLGPGGLGDVSQVIQELEGNGEHPNLLRPIYDNAVKKGAKAKHDLEATEINVLSMVLTGHDFRPLEHSSPFPENYEIDYSWSGLQTYPFEDLLRSLTMQESSLGAFESTFGNAESQRGPIVYNRHSYRKVNLNEIIQSHKPPATLRLITSSSAENQHFSFRWPWERSVYQEEKLEDLLYHCWRIGSNDHDEPSPLGLSENMKYYQAIPAVPLKYITIWGIEEPKTLIVLRLIYISWAKSQGSTPEKFSLTYSQLEDDRQKEHWNAIIGTPAILPIAEMCLSYVTGLRSCNIAAIHFSFHQPLSISEKVITWSSNSVSVVVELTTNIKEEDLHLNVDKNTFRIQKAWDRVKKFGILPGPGDDLEFGGAGLSDEDQNMLDLFADYAPNGLHDFPMPISEAQVELERTKLDLSYSAVGYPSLSIIENPFLPTLRERVHYIPSGGPSYTRIKTTQNLVGAESYRVLYYTAMSSQEKNLLFIDYQVQKREGEKGKGKAKAAEDGIPVDEEDFVPSVLDPDTEGQFKINFGTVLFATWFSQEGWSQISRITFQTIHPETVSALEVFLDEANPIITWKRDTPAIWNQNVELFYTTMEGGAVKYFLEEKDEFLTSPTIKAIHIGIHIDDRDKHFIHVDFGDDKSDAKSEGQLMFKPTSLLENLFLRGAKGQATERILGAQFDDPEWNGRNYVYDDKKDRDHLSKYVIVRQGPFDNRRWNKITYYLEDNDLLKGLSSTFVQRFAKEKVRTGYQTWSLHERSQGNLGYDFATSPSVAGNLVLINTPFSGEGNRADIGTIVNHLSDAMYAAWINADFVEKHQYARDAVRRGIVGMRVFTALQVLPESRMALEQIYRKYNDLVNDGLLSLERNARYLRLPQLALHRTAARAQSRRMERLWVSLSGLAETSALISMLSSFQEQMNQARWGQKLLIFRIAIRRTEGDDENIRNNAADFQMIFIIEKSRTPLTMTSRNAEAQGKDPQDRKLELMLADGDEALTVGLLSEVEDKIDEEFNRESFDIQASELQVTKDSGVLAIDTQEWIQAIRLELDKISGSTNRKSRNMRWRDMKVALPPLDGKTFYEMHVRPQAEDTACQIVAGTGSSQLEEVGVPCFLPANRHLIGCVPYSLAENQAFVLEFGVYPT